MPRGDLASALRELQRDPDVAAASWTASSGASPRRPSSSPLPLGAAERSSMPGASATLTRRRRGLGRSGPAPADRRGRRLRHRRTTTGSRSAARWLRLGQQDIDPQDGDGHGTHVDRGRSWPAGERRRRRRRRAAGRASAAPRARRRGVGPRLRRRSRRSTSPVMRASASSTPASEPSARSQVAVQRHPRPPGHAVRHRRRQRVETCDNDVLSAADYPCAYDLANILCVGASTTQRHAGVVLELRRDDGRRLRSRRTASCRRYRNSNARMTYHAAGRRWRRRTWRGRRADAGPQPCALDAATSRRDHPGDRRRPRTGARRQAALNR